MKRRLRDLVRGMGHYARRISAVCRRFLRLGRLGGNPPRIASEAQDNLVAMGFTDYFDYTRKCRGYDPHAYGLWQDYYAAMMDSAFQLRDKLVLDVGCAAGGMAFGFAKLGAIVRGVEISESVVAESPFRSVPIYVTETDRFAELFSPDSFDVVHSSQVFEHFPDQDYSARVVDCIFKVLKPGGLVYASFVAGGHLTASELIEMERSGVSVDVTHVNIWPLEWWENLFASAGFHDVTDVFEVIIDCFQAADGFSFFREYRWTQKAWVKGPHDGTRDGLAALAAERLRAMLERQASYADLNVYREVLSARMIEPRLADIVRSFC